MSDSHSDLLAPHSVGAEKAVLGSILINAEALLEVAAFLYPADFFIERHGWIFQAMLSLSERHDPIDYLTVVDEMEQVGKLADAGGAAYVLLLVNKTPSALNIEGYGRIVERMALRRRLLAAAGQVARIAHSEETDIDEVVNQAESAIFSVTQYNGHGPGQSLKELASEQYDQVTYLLRNPDKVVGVKTYLADVDHKINALRNGELHFVAARPGMGKSGFVLTVTYENAKRGIPVGIISLEMDGALLARRLVALEGGIDTKRLQSGHLKEDEVEPYHKYAEAVGRLPIYIDDTPAMTPMQLRTVLTRWRYLHGIELAVVDYVQLMSGGGRYNNRAEEISYISRTLKRVAQELNIPILAAAQLNRMAEQRNDHRPMLSDLKESGSLEQDAFMVFLLYRDHYYDESAPLHTAELRVAKNRGGDGGTVDLYFDGPTVKFSNAALRK